MIKVYRYDSESSTGAWHSGDELARNGEAFKTSTDLLWIDLECPTEEEEQLVFKTFFTIHTLSLEDIAHLKRFPDKPPHFPKVEEFPDYLFVIVNPLSSRLLENISEVASENAEVLFENGGMVTQLSAVLTHRMLITHHYEPVRGVTEARGYIEAHTRSAKRGPDYVFHLILDEMVDEYAPVLDHLSDRLDTHETNLFERPSKETLTQLVGCKRAIVVLRKTLIYEREILARLSRGEFELIDEREAVYYRNVYDHLIRFAELIEAAREMVGDLMQMHLGASANRLNEIMKTLTMISTVILPMTLIAGIYGMNFENMTLVMPVGEESHWLTYVVMLLVGLAPLAVFKWKKWI